MKLTASFYQRSNVVHVARELIGKGLFTRINGTITGGMIVEAEAYSWRERGSHAYNRRRTPRNEVMYGAGGLAYVYVCYGIHNLFNIVTNKVEMPEAVLIRAIEPLKGEELMMRRRGDLKDKHQLTSGPGKLTRALGIDRSFNGKSLLDGEVWVEDLGKTIPRNKIERGKRIGIEYAGVDADLPWRFWIRDNPWVS